jgi:transcriptional regulator
LSAENYVSADDRLVAAEDASIVREALSRLSSAQRTALVMWEVEGRSTKEIAKELGTSTSNVRHIVVRARGSFVRVLNEWIIDSDTGTTALEALSTSYKKAAELAKKSSRAALSLIVVLVAFLGFNSITGTELVTNFPKIINQPTSVTSSTETSAPAHSPSDNQAMVSRSKTATQDVNAKSSNAIFYGTDLNGLPTGFTVADSSGNIGSILVTNQSLTQNPDGFTLNSNALSASPNAINVLLAQSVVFRAGGIDLNLTPSVTINGTWFALDLSSIELSSMRRPDGSYLLSASLYVNSTIQSIVPIETKNGLNVNSIPNKIQTAIIIDSTKSKVLAQAIFVNAQGVK